VAGFNSGLKKMGMKIGAQLPSLEGATEWFNGTQAHAESEALGHPTLVHFWSVSCGICKENLPRVAQLRDEKRAQGLRVIGVHMPMYKPDLDVERVRDSISKYGMTEPVAVDHRAKLRDAFLNDEGYVPAYYFFDAQGKLRSFAAGDRGLNMVVAAIERILPAQEKVASVANPGE
jgi:thiol-disulfide isomerase/thioredoxin